MKLELSIPERVGMMSVIPAANVFALLLAVLLLSPSLILQSGIPIDVPVTEGEVMRYADPIVVSVTAGEKSKIYLEREEVTAEDLEKKIKLLIDSGRYSEGDTVLIRADKLVNVELERAIIETVQKLGLRCALAARPKN